MARRRASGILLLAAAATHPAAAQPPEPDGVRPGWYAAQMVSSISFDSSRDGSSADGFALALGYRWNWLALEARGEYLESLQFTDRFFVPGPNPGDPPEERREVGGAALSGGLFSLLLEPLQLFAPLDRLSFLEHLYATLGAGMVKFQNHGTRRQDEKNFPYEAGLGLVYPFKLWGFGLAVRAEAIYRLDPGPNEPASEPDPQDRYEDVLYHAGLQIPLSRSPRDPRAEPVKVIAPAYSDTDDDGVVDQFDRCPDTPADSLVNNVGCVPETL